ncbi:MAG TPA: SigE family RNA polymerase sigma factor [Acidimicrobiales bacterium]|nr:SigE family RNA polymerase sigma factor [Acidimicrobiales bacterium]
MRSHRDDEFREFVRRQRPALLRTSRALAGGDPHLAEDLVQTCLVKLYLAWPRVRSTRVDRYARRVLVNALIDEKRGPFHRREQVWAEPPDSAAADVAAARAEQASGRDELLAALGRLPAGMRAAVVLRHVDGLSTDEAAHALRCSPGTVKSQTARGLARLRELLAGADPDPVPATAAGTRELHPTRQGDSRP